MTDPTQAEVPAGKLCDFYLGDCQRCGRRAERDNQQEPCARPNGPFSPSTSVQGAGEAFHEMAVPLNPAGSGLSAHALRLRLIALAAALRREEWDEDHAAAADVEEAARRLSTPPAPASVADHVRDASNMVADEARAREDAVLAGRAVLAGEGDGTYDEACDAITQLLAFAARPAGEVERLREALERIAAFKPSPATGDWADKVDGQGYNRAGNYAAGIARAALTEGTPS